MESMRRSEANNSHHPNKVAVNSIVTESNNKSSGSGSLNNNTKISYSLQQQHIKAQLATTISHKPTHLTTKDLNTKLISSSGSSTPQSSTSSSNPNTSSTTATSSSTSSTSSESKDTNFEYDDNEWDVGGIGDLIIDLDADIEKSASTTPVAVSQNIASGNSGTTGTDSTQIIANKNSTLTSLVSGNINQKTTSGTTHIQSGANLQSDINANDQKNLQQKQAFSSTTSLSSRSNSSNSLSCVSSTSTTSINSSPNKLNHISLSSSGKSPNFPTIQGSILQKSLSAPTSSGYNSSSSSSILSPSILSATSKINNNNNQLSLKHSQHNQKVNSNLHQNLKLQQPSLVAQLNKTSPIDNLNSSGRFSNLSSKSGTNTSGIHLQDKQSFTLSNNPNNLSSILSSSTKPGQVNSTSLFSTGVQSSSGNSNSSSSMSSQPSSGQGAGKSATKMSIDHQATLDKGLKMKIKRTKPGTKTSEAKHEIVKAEQNGTSGGIDGENNSSSGQPNSLLQNMSSSSLGGNTNSNSGSGKTKHSNQLNQGSSIVQQQLSSVQPATTPTTNKRGSSGHRRDKAREKQPHSRDKSEHNSNNSNSSNSNSSNSSATSSMSNSTERNNSSSGNAVTNSSSMSNCNCSHEMNGSGSVQNNCSSINCPRNRNSNSSNSLDQSLSNRLSGGQNQSNNLTHAQSINTSGLNSSNNKSAGVFNNSSNSSANSNNVQSSNNSNTPNAPGPPVKDSKMLNNNSSLQNSQHNSNQIHNLGLTNSQQSQQQSNNNKISNSGNINSSANGQQQNSLNMKHPTNSSHISATVHHTISVTANSPLAVGQIKSNCDDGIQSPPAKKIKTEAKDMVDVCIGTSVGTITEPDCLGPCEPGTSVTLEGIVWHETEGGVLVVNVTWRGKTYVGTLLDCTRHDWAPPRFCDSPTEELDSRTPKGRAKRGRSGVLGPDLSNFTETRSSVHSKLRNGGTKGRGGRTTTASTTASTTTTTTTSTANSNGNGILATNAVTNASGAPITTTTTSICNTPSQSPTNFLPPRSEKRKSKDESPSPVNGESAANSDTSQNGNNNQSTQIIVNPITGLNVQISNKKCKTASPCAISPVLLECPEQDCNKKYKHANGLRYHQSHAHGSGGSMDEDSSTLPESPTRAAPPTTPSPAPPPSSTPPVQQPSNTPTPAINSVEGSSPTAPATSTIGNANSSVVSTSAFSPTTQVSTVSTPQATVTVSPSTVATPVAATVTVSVQSNTPVANTTLTSSTGPTPLSTPSILAVTSNAPPLITPIQTTPVASNLPQQHSIAGGSITAGISSQALSAQHQQQLHQQQQQQHQPQQQQQQQQQQQPNSQTSHSLLVGGSTVPNQALLTNNPTLTDQITGVQGSTTPLLTQPPPPALHSGLVTPTRGDQPIKPGVLRFVPQTDPNNLSNQQSPLRPSNIGQLNPNTIQDSPYGQPPNSQGIPINKSQNLNKQKKTRKSPVPGEFDSTTSRDDTHSPAYSDISDDSPSNENDLSGDKSKQSQPQDMIKKPQENSGVPPPIPSLGGYGMYQFYAQQAYMVPPPQSDHPQNNGPQSVSKLPTSQAPPAPPVPSLSTDFNKNKDPPLDLMTKPPSNNNDSSSKESPINNPSSQPPPGMNIGPPGPPGKPMPHFYPFNYMPGYPYNVDPNYGPVPMVNEDGKINSGPPNQAPPSSPQVLKDDRPKESPSPHSIHDIGKITSGQSPQMISNKILNQQKEQQLKDLNKDQNSHPLHQKETLVQSISSYPGMYQRHPSLGVPQQGIPPNHLSRDEELRRYYIYPDQRRSSQPPPNNNPPITTIKEEPPSPQPGQNMHHPSPQSQQQQQQQNSQISHSPQQMQQSQNSGPIKPTKPVPQQSSLSSNNNQKPTNLIKEIKEEKDVKIKQEGQKPTMETQGPPPPPTSQYFLHPSYISPGPFGFDPSHPMYRNVLMSAGPYNAPPYHLPMARFHAPEDLSRNPGTKALDALQHAASQYYTTHKIHELSERAIKSPTSNNANPSNNMGGSSKVVNVSSPNIPQSVSGPGNIPGVVSGPNPGIVGGPSAVQTGLLPPSNVGGGSGPLNLQPSGGPGSGMGSLGGNSGGPPQQSQSINKGDTGKTSSNDPSPLGKQIGGGVPPPNSMGGTGGLSGPGGTATDSRSPPPQRHVHTHHHTHVGLGYPMYPAPYGAAVLASQQAAAVAVINPFPPGPSK